MAKDDADADKDTDHTISGSSARGKPLLFYKLVVASMIRDNKLKIPGKVVRKIEQELSIVVTLTVPDGRKWNMKLGKDDGGKCWLGDSWVEFMKHYSVRVGYLLVFRYKGDSTFAVNVFDLSSAEIQYSVGGCEKVGEDKEPAMKNGKRSGNVRTKMTSGSEKVGQDKKFPVTKGSGSGNERVRKKPGSAKNRGKKVREGKESVNGGTGKKLGSKDVEDDELYLLKEDEETGNDGANKKLGSSQQMPGVVCGLRSNLIEFHTECMSQIEFLNGGSEKVRLEKQSSMNNDGARNRSGSANIRQENQCTVSNGIESERDVNWKNLAMCPPGFAPKSSQQMAGMDHGVSPQSKLGESHTEFLAQTKNHRGGSSCAVEKQVKPGRGADSLGGSFPLVKDVTLGYYRANVMKSKEKKPARVRKVRNPRPKNPGRDRLGLGKGGVRLNSPAKEKLTPEMPISKMAREVALLADQVSVDAKCEGRPLDHMPSAADGVEVKLPVPQKLTSETQLCKQAMNVASPGLMAEDSTLHLETDQLGTGFMTAEVKSDFPPEEPLLVMITDRTRLDSTRTPVKRKKEMNISDLLDQTLPMTLAIKQEAEVNKSDLICRTTAKTAASQKKLKSIQLSEIPHRHNPYCTVHVRASYLQKKGYLHMPAKFAMKYLKETSGRATLENSEGKQWEVRIGSSNVRITLSQGWHQFAMDNHLKEGDTCNFELLDSVNTLLKVTFVRSPKEPPPPNQEVLKL
uniref:TF-B3 domain-containing protein n=1 Tax=Kalanchoe fedtschenkoi TaxID=63787 RepID=A0A7N0VG50_KALFE